MGSLGETGTVAHGVPRPLGRAHLSKFAYSIKQISLEIILPLNITMVQGTHTHWRMTINNYDATDLALVQQGYPDHIRQIVYTLEEGEEGTPHIQAFIKMKRDCRMSHMKKLFPRGNFGVMDSSERKLNQQRYAQKLDSTAKSPAVIIQLGPSHDN